MLFLTGEHRAKILLTSAWASEALGGSGCNTWWLAAGVLPAGMGGRAGHGIVGVVDAAGQAKHPDQQPGQAFPLRPPAPPYRLWGEAGTTCSHKGPALDTPNLWVALAWLAAFPVPGTVGTSLDT